MPEDQESRPETEASPSAEQTETENPLRSFLVALATDHTLLGRFIRDPEAVMGSAGLSADDRAVLKSANPSIIHARLTGQVTATAAPVTVLVVDIPGGEPSIRQVIHPQFVIHPQQIFPQQVIHPQQIFPQQIFPQMLLQQIFPQQQ